MGHMDAHTVVYAMYALIAVFVFMVLVLLYLNYRRYKRLRARTEEALRNINAHMDRKYNLKYGTLYLYLDFMGENYAPRAFFTLLKLGFKGMLVYPEARPLELKSIDPGIRTNIISTLVVTRKDVGSGYVNPTKLEALLEEISAFISDVKSKGREGIVLLHGLELLYSDNGAERMRVFIERLKASLTPETRTMVFISLNPKAVDKAAVKWLRTVTINGNVFWVNEGDFKTFSPNT